MLDLVGTLATKDTEVKYLGKSAYFMMFNPNVTFVCPIRGSTLYLAPISVRLTFKTRPQPQTLAQGNLQLQSSAITFSTKNNVVDALHGHPVCVYGESFKLNGRLRRSKFDRHLSQYTFSRYLVLSVSRITHRNTCIKCRESSSGCCGAPDCRALFESKL